MKNLLKPLFSRLLGTATERQPKRSAAYQLGYEAYLGPMSKKKCPYGDRTQAADEWWSGYHDAQADTAV